MMAEAMADQVKRTLDAEEQVRRDTIIEERTGVLNLARRSREGTAVHVRNGRLSADVAEQIDRAVFVFAEKVAIGLHVEAETDPVVRAQLREVVRALEAASTDAGTGQ